MATRRWAVVDTLLSWGEWMAAALTVYLMLSVVLGVVARAAVGQPQAWVIELAGPAMVTLTMVSVAAVAKVDGHVRLSLLDEVLPPRRLEQLARVSMLIELIVVAVLLWATTKQWWADLQSGVLAPGYIRIDRWKLTAFVPPGLLLYVLHLIRSLLRGDSSSPPEGQKQTAPGATAHSPARETL